MPAPRKEPGDRVLASIARARRRLNALVVASGGLAWLGPGAAVGGIACLALDYLGVGGEGAPFLGFWTLLSLLAFAAGSALASRRRLDLEGAAAWLDRRLGSRELLSALVTRRVEGDSGGRRFDGELASRAEALLPRALRPGYPLRGLAARASASLGACLVFGALLAADPLGGLPSRPSGNQDSALGRKLAAVAAGSARLSETEASAAAGALFPRDGTAAALAEAALREGRTADLRDLILKAEKDIDELLARRPGEEGRKSLLDERKKLEEAEGALSEDNGEGGSAGGEAPSGGDEGGTARGPAAPGEGKGALPRKPGRPPEPGSDDWGGAEGKKGGSGEAPGQASPPGGGPPQGEAPGGGQGPKDGGGGKSGDGEGLPGPEGGGATGGSEAGSGSGTAVERGTLAPRTGGGELTIAPDRTSPFYEYVLSGRDPATPPSELALEAERSAESAIGSGDLPLELLEFIRSYFHSLSSLPPGAAGGAGEGASK